MEETGLVMQSNKFYVRKACKDLWAFLDCNSGNIRSVVGPPGLGKSIAVFVYAVQKAINHRLIYIHGVDDIIKVVYGQNGHYKTSNEISKDNEKLLKNWLEYNVRSTDLIVVDGTDTSFIKYLMRLCKHISLIICTSFQALDLNSEQQTIFQVKEFIMDSWALDEYKSALEAKVFSFTEEELLERYYYSGGSIRYMFWTLEDVIYFLDKKIRGVDDYFKLLTNNIGPSSDSAVNTLLSTKAVRGLPMTSLISEYVTKSLSANIRPLDRQRFIGDAREMSPLNPSLQGWLTELDVDLESKIQKMVFLFFGTKTSLNDLFYSNML